MPFIKPGFFRMGFWQPVLVEEGAVAAVVIGRVTFMGHEKTTAE